jgi:hypothetical protein
MAAGGRGSRAREQIDLPGYWVCHAKAGMMLEDSFAESTSH